MTCSDLTLPRLLHHDSFAVISTCGRYRYWLHRSWTFGEGWTVFVMLNPSTADATLDDPTIRRCISFAKAFGSRGLIVVNLFAWRATDPEAMADVALCDVEGPENHAYVTKACELAAQREPLPSGRMRTPGKVICAWGAHWMAKPQAPTMIGWIEATGAKPLCLGRTKAGAPRHPLYLPGGAAPQPFNLFSEVASA